MREQPTMSFFSKENRARFLHILMELFPPAQHSSEGISGGEELRALEKMANYRLGRLSLASGNSLVARFVNFVQQASEDDIFEIIKLMPEAQRHATQETYREVGAWPALGDGQVRHVIGTMNAFFKEFGCGARFRMDGRFDREGLMEEKPKALLALPNREVLRQDVAALLQQGKHVALIFVDLDNFKQVNERYGHTAGDGCLEQAVKVLYGVIEGRAKLYRYGKDAGDEFVLMMLNVDSSECSATANRIRVAIEQAKLGEDVGVTASVGVSCTDRPGLDSANKLIEAADEAASISKHTGKNRVITWPPGPEERLAAEQSRMRDSR